MVLRNKKKSFYELNKNRKERKSYEFNKANIKVDFESNKNSFYEIFV